MNAPLNADLNLILQIIILALLIAGFSIARLKRKFRGHGAFMGIVLTLNTISIAIIMLPSFLSFSGLFVNLSTPAAIVITHAILGLLVEVAGFWLLANWLFRSGNIKGCFGKKNLMIGALFLWFIELFTGIYIYVMLYVPL
jgi:hypothetical protein